MVDRFSREVKSLAANGSISGDLASLLLHNVGDVEFIKAVLGSRIDHLNPSNPETISLDYLYSLLNMREVEHVFNKLFIISLN